VFKQANGEEAIIPISIHNQPSQVKTRYLYRFFRKQKKEIQRVVTGLGWLGG
jgi:hypothetical protein